MPILRFNIDEIENEAEHAFALVLQQFLGPDDVVYWNREVGGKEFDFAILSKGQPVTIIEVKGWTAERIKSVHEEDYVEVWGREGDFFRSNPRKQVRAHRYAFVNFCKNHLGYSPQVVHGVAFPFLSQKDMVNHQLFIVCPDEITFYADNLASPEEFLKKLQGIREETSGVAYPLTDSSMVEVRSLFEPNLLDIWSKQESSKAYNPLHGSRYSVLVHIPNTDRWQQQIDDLVHLYGQGIRVYVTVTTIEMLEYARHQIHDFLRSQNLLADNSKIIFATKDKGGFHGSHDGNHLTLFNWTMGVVNHIDRPICIIDGQNIQEDDLQDWFNQIRTTYAFNFEQYRIEHAPLDHHIMVRAGAGSGKTFAMILRLTYLIIQGSDQGEGIDEFLGRIGMITFTNEAADNMRKRLSQWFQNYYLLTGHPKFFRLASKVDHMRIGTIHQYVEWLLQQGSMDMGLGRNFDIVSSTYERDRVLERNLNRFISIHGLDVLERGELAVYELSEILSSAWTQLNNMNLNVSKLTAVQLGHPAKNDGISRYIHDLLTDLLPRIDQEFSERLQQRNQLYLGHLISRAYGVLRDNPKRYQGDEHPQYLFVDEFQDTDNIQISLVSHLSRLRNQRLFVVGDIKQCIYRFRGAEERAFDYLQRLLANDHWMSFDLQINYRTDQRLLNFFNRALGHNKVNDYIVFGDTDYLFGIKSYPVDTLRLYQKVLLSPSGDNRMEVLVEQVNKGRELIQTLGSGLSINEKTIAILVRENWQVATIVEELQAQGIQVQARVAGGVFRSAAALDLHLLLQTLLNPNPDMLFQLITSRWFSFDINKMAILRLRLQTFNNYRERIATQLENFIDQILAQAVTHSSLGYSSWRFVLQDLKLKPVLEVVQTLYDELKPWTSVQNQLGPEAADQYRTDFNIILEKVIRAVGLDGVGLLPLASMLERFILANQRDTSPVAERDDDSFRVVCTTVHQAKGLEFGVVILPYADLVPSRGRSQGVSVVCRVLTENHIGYQVEVEKDGRNRNIGLANNYFDEIVEDREQDEEEARLLYVAMTRAMYRFVWFTSPKKNSKITWQRLLEERR